MWKTKILTLQKYKHHNYLWNTNIFFVLHSCIICLRLFHWKVLHLMIRLLINIYNANLQFLEPYVLNRTPNKHRIVVIFSYQKYFFILQGISKWWWSTFLCNWRKITEVLYFVVYFMVEKISLCLGLYGFIFFTS